MQKEFIINSNDITSTTKVDSLLQTEQSVLNHMLISYENYHNIKAKIKVDDFTFITHRYIYITLCDFENYIIEKMNKQFTVESIDLLIKVITHGLEEKQKLIKKGTIQNIFAKSPNLSLEEDLNLILFYSMEKELAKKSHNTSSNTVEYEFEDLTSFTRATYIQNRLIEILTTNIDNIPHELCDTTIGTMDFMNEIDLNNPNINMTLSPPEEEPQGRIIFYIQKDYPLLKEKKEKFEKLFKWADKYDLQHHVLPRDIQALEELTELKISHQDIQELPKELLLLKNLTVLDASFNKIASIADELSNHNSLRFIFLESNELKDIPEALLKKKNLLFLSLKKNHIQSVPSSIENLKTITHLCMCCNHIKKLPNSFVKLERLTSFCIHGNKLQSIPDKWSELTHLSRFCFSNNHIKTIPSSIFELNELKELEFENNDINEISSEIKKLLHLETLTCDDELLKDIEPHLNHLKFNCIDISESNIKSFSFMVDKFLFDVQNQDKWIDPLDKRENGCIKLLKKEL